MLVVVVVVVAGWAAGQMIKTPTLFLLGGQLVPVPACQP